MDGFDDDQHGDREQEAAVGKRRQHFDARVTERLAHRRGAPVRFDVRDQRDPEREGVHEHVGGVGKQR